jgi:hypothetical protein
MLKEAAGYREDILRAYHWAQARMPVYPLKDGTSVPGYPSQLTAPGPTNNFFPGEDGNRSWCYDVELGAHHLVPQEVLDARSREVGDMMDHMEECSSWLTAGSTIRPNATRKTGTTSAASRKCSHTTAGTSRSTLSATM